MAEWFSVMKLTVKLVGKAQLIRQNHRETKFIFSNRLFNGMILYYESDSEVSRKSTID